MAENESAVWQLTDLSLARTIHYLAKKPIATHTVVRPSMKSSCRGGNSTVDVRGMLTVCWYHQHVCGWHVPPSAFIMGSRSESMQHSFLTEHTIRLDQWFLTLRIWVNILLQMFHGVGYRFCSSLFKTKFEKAFSDSHSQIQGLIIV